MWDLLYSTKSRIALPVLLISIVLLFAACGTSGTKGSCGEELEWEITESGILRITGNGSMYTYSHNQGRWTTPWSKHGDEIVSIIIDDGVESIGDYAFMDCKNLTEVSIPESIKTIGDCAFMYCAKIESITIPEGVVSIGLCAFSDCTSLRSIMLPYSIDEIGMIAFPETEIYYSGNEQAWNKISIVSKDDTLRTVRLHYAEGASMDDSTVSDEGLSTNDGMVDSNEVEQIDFQEFTLEWGHREGYKLHGRFAFSDWIKYDDTERLDVAWKTAANNAQEFPSFKNYAEVGSNYFGRHYTSDMYICDDIAYLVGYMEIENVTEGFSIQSPTFIKVPMNFFVNTPFSIMAVVQESGQHLYPPELQALSRVQECKKSDGVFTDERYVEQAMKGNYFFDKSAGTPEVVLQSDASGRIPFVIAVGIAHGPQFPDGIPDFSKLYVVTNVQHCEDGSIWYENLSDSVSPGISWE